MTTETYEIRLDGHLDDHWAGWLGGLELARADDGSTTVTLPAADQARLHGVLAALRDVGATLTGLRALDTTAGSALASPLRTERLTLRPASADDADRTWPYRCLDVVNEWLAGCPADLDGYHRQFTEPARLARTLVLTLGHDPDAPVIGDLMLRREDAWAQREVTDRACGAQAEIGWVLDPAHAGHGYATEAVCELLRHCFEDLHLHRVHAVAFLANERSWRLMERVGMRREHHAVRESLHRSGEWMDTVAYALLDDEWPPR